ncbi:MAG: hypothetical protein MJ106_07175 [Lentisphaeria bacterium]|nr:hypothetical protein [Lentisphaeria bacterium]
MSVKKGHQESSVVTAVSRRHFVAFFRMAIIHLDAKKIPLETAGFFMFITLHINTVRIILCRRDGGGVFQEFQDVG